MTDYQTIETLARRLAAERGCDYDRKGAKRKHWRDEAAKVIESGSTHAWDRVRKAIASLTGWLS